MKTAPRLQTTVFTPHTRKALCTDANLFATTRHPWSPAGYRCGGGARKHAVPVPHLHTWKTRWPSTSAPSCPRQCRLQVEQGGAGSRHQLQLLWENATSRHPNLPLCATWQRTSTSTEAHTPLHALSSLQRDSASHSTKSRSRNVPSPTTSLGQKGSTVVAAAQLRTLAGPHSRARWFFLRPWLSL